MFIDRLVSLVDSRINGRQGYGLIQVITGDGKGKTTSAIGTLVRAVGAGKRAAIIFFDKGGEHYSERPVLKNLGVEVWAFGRDRIDPKTGRFDFSVTDEDRALGKAAMEKARSLVLSDPYDLLVLDEVNSSTALGFVNEEEVLKFLEVKPERLELILTGRNAPKSFLEKAHLQFITSLQISNLRKTMDS